MGLSAPSAASKRLLRRKKAPRGATATQAPACFRVGLRRRRRAPHGATTMPWIRRRREQALDGRLCCSARLENTAALQQQPSAPSGGGAGWDGRVWEPAATSADLNHSLHSLQCSTDQAWHARQRHVGHIKRVLLVTGKAKATRCVGLANPTLTGTVRFRNFSGPCAFLSFPHPAVVEVGYERADPV
eukprot:357914-Chlamydomonas_euryale.AAC.2